MEKQLDTGSFDFVLKISLDSDRRFERQTTHRLSIIHSLQRKMDIMSAYLAQLISRQLATFSRAASIDGFVNSSSRYSFQMQKTTYLKLMSGQPIKVVKESGGVYTVTLEVTRYF